MFHRDNDLPAVIYSNGHKEWWQHNKLHRDNDKPAIISSDGMKHWWKNGQRHRENGKPAVIFSDGTKRWYQNGKRYFKFSEGLSKDVCKQCPKSKGIEDDKCFCSVLIYAFKDCPFVLEHLMKTQKPFTTEGITK